MQPKSDKFTKNSSKSKSSYMVSNKGNYQSEEIHREPTSIAQLQSRNVALVNTAREIQKSLKAEQGRNESLNSQNQELSTKCKNLQSQVENQKIFNSKLTEMQKISNSKLTEDKQKLCDEVDQLQQKNRSQVTQIETLNKEVSQEQKKGNLLALKVQQLQAELEKAKTNLKEQIDKDNRIQHAKFEESIKLNSNPPREEKSKDRLSRKKSKKNV